MSQNNNADGNNGNGNNAPKVGWAVKAGYIGTGVLIGLVVYPFVRKALGKVQPKVDEFFDSLTGKAESMAEKASDIMAKARDNLNGSKKSAKEHDHNHSHEHDLQ